MRGVSCLNAERVKFIEKMILIVTQYAAQITQLGQTHQVMNFWRKNATLGNDGF
jgi:hypothetical protein